MEYLKPSFTFVPGRSETYRKNFDQIDWGKDRKTSEQVLAEKRQAALAEEKDTKDSGHGCWPNRGGLAGHRHPGPRFRIVR